jgi:hypothetical protein
VCLYYIRGPPVNGKSSKEHLGMEYRGISRSPGTLLSCADVVKLANTAVLKTATPVGVCGFESHHPHHETFSSSLALYLAQRA